jgi:DNA-binding MarR family transcriptional regulator/N-acetylglutamate synthase-like GNAT family acetyltransferase
MVGSDGLPTVDAVRRFNRFYTRRIGVLSEGLLGSPFSLTEGRVLYELAQHETVTASELRAGLGLDAGYLSRILKGFEARDQLVRRPDATDGRQSVLALTEAGRAAFAEIDGRSRDEVATLLAGLSASEQLRLTGAMAAIEALLGERGPGPVAHVLRPHRPGDMGWIVHRHGLLYAEEYGFDERFEALVAGIVAEFVERHDARRERCWIAEQDGEIVGSVFLVAKSAEVAKLRLLLVEPRARGQRLGTRLVDECLSFARYAGYRTVTLWTNSILEAAIHLYQNAGFQLVDEEPHRSFGQDLVGQTWELSL